MQIQRRPAAARLALRMNRPVGRFAITTAKQPAGRRRYQSQRRPPEGGRYRVKTKVKINSESRELHGFSDLHVRTAFALRSKHSVRFAEREALGAIIAEAKKAWVCEGVEGTQIGRRAEIYEGWRSGDDGGAHLKDIKLRAESAGVAIQEIGFDAGPVAGL